VVTAAPSEPVEQITPDARPPDANWPRSTASLTMSADGAPISATRQYIEQQNRPA
jgi:hypothetical protein